MTDSKKNVWKYSTFGLLAILAVGVSFPQALGDITNNVNHMLTHIYNFTDGIEAKTNNLPSDPASNTVVNTRASQTSVNSLQSDINGLETKVDGMESRLDAMPGRIITFDDFELTEAMMPYEIIPDDEVGHGIYVDIDVSDKLGIIILDCSGVGIGHGGHSIDSGANTIDLGCDGLELERDADCDQEECSATLNGSIRYTNEYVKLS